MHELCVDDVYDLDDLISSIDQFVDAWVQKNTEVVLATTLGLDARVGSVRVMVDGSGICTNSSRLLEYYGGFEYVKSPDRTVVGSLWVFYSSSHDRVATAVERWENR